MSRTGCEIAGRHNWAVVLDDEGWWPVAVVCDDWECSASADIAIDDADFAADVRDVPISDASS